MSRLAANAEVLEEELAWFSAIIDARFANYFEAAETDPADHPPPDLKRRRGPYAETVCALNLDADARLALVLALTPHVRPRLLDIFHTRNATFDRRFTEFGGLAWGSDGDFRPTGETFLFLAAGNDLARRFVAQRVFATGRPLAREGMLLLQRAVPDDPPMKGALRLSEAHLHAFTDGEAWRPDPGSSFPAHRLETAMDWSSLTLTDATREHIREIESWVRHGPTLMKDWGMAKTLRPGWRSLFYGPPGTGKTLTATMLGKITGRDVYRIDLSQVVSKYIGETEKNLSQVFDRAQNRNWILFFDEADALFGRRGETRDSHDRYANQEVAYLLQRIESFDGVAILASNMRENIDSAFARRFESIIYFPPPDAALRLRLWRQAFGKPDQLETDVDLDFISREYELSGGAIVNVVRTAALAALANERKVTMNDLKSAVRREFAKEGRTG